MNVREDIRSRGVEDLVAAFQAQEVVLERQFPPLQHGAHRPISNDDPMVHRIQKLLGADGGTDSISSAKRGI